MITLNYNLGIYPVNNGCVARLSQYDSDFTLVFSLYTTYGEFELESGTTAQIRGTKADGCGYSATATVDITNQTVTVAGDEQLTAAAGENTFELRLLKGDKQLHTVNFTIWVERSALDAGTITSESVLLELNALIEGAATATEAAETATAAAEAAEEAASTLVIDPTLTTSSQPADAKVVGDALVSGLAPRYDATAPYAVGDYFLKDNILYRAKTAIAAGATITVGTNVEIVPLGNAVTSLNSNINNCLQLVSVAGSGQGTYTFPSGKFGFCVWAVGTSTAGLTFLYAAGGALQAVKVTATSTSNNPTFTYSNGVLTIKNNGTSYMRGSLVFT